jgi:NADPH-dependent 7-cyano-7-deazaguanine reductase QueF
MSNSQDVLRTFGAPPSPSVTTIETEEVTAICPFDYGSGRDFYDLTIRYEPDETAVETKSLRDWLRSMDNEEVTVERYAHRVYTALSDAVDPERLYVRLEQNIRGGLQHTEEVGDVDLR